jgi:Rad3-related DNA helicase
MKVMKEFFPWKTPRAGQVELCEQIKGLYDDGVKFVILQAPTGIGKSVISYTLANELQNKDKKTYILTSQKSLQDQYVDDFDDVLTIKGASNFTCDINKQTCDVGSCKTSKKITCECPYKVQRDNAYNNPITLLNYPYFLNMSTNHLQESREFLICDEAHNLENQLIGYSELTINYNSYKLHNLRIIKLPSRKSSEEEIIDWVQDKLIPGLLKMEQSLMMDLETVESDSEKSKTGKALSFVKNQLTKARRIKHGTQWSIQHKDGFNLSVKPLFVNDVSNSLIFDKYEKILLMSATILDSGQFCKDLGIDVSQAVFIDLPSNFPVENRPIFDLSAAIGQINYKTMDEVKPKMVEVINKLLERHKGEMGIIHAPSYALAKYIVDNVDSDRLVLPQGSTREKTITMFTEKQFKKNDKVLISPSLTEGIDLKGDLGTFCVVCKAPFASLADPFIKKRSSLDRQWYQIETLRKFIQSCGRITRSETDVTATYVLDVAIFNMINQNRRCIPDWFMDSIKRK